MYKNVESTSYIHICICYIIIYIIMEKPKLQEFNFNSNREAKDPKFKLQNFQRREMGWDTSVFKNKDNQC